MSGWQRIYYKLLNLPLQVLVKSKSIPAEPAQELGLDTSRPVMYVLPYNSKADLLTLRAQCLAHDLPDPLEPLEIDGALLPRYVFIHGGPRVFTYYTPKEESIKLFHDYLDLHRNHPDLDVQMVPVSVMFGRSPGREKGEVNPPLRMLNGIQKFFAVSWLGRDSFVRFSPSVSLRRMADEHGTDKIIAQKLARVARMHFARQRLAAVGPRLPARQDLFNKLLASKAIARAVEDEARSKKISHEKAQQNAIALMEEIAANFSYEMIRLTDRILGFTWNRLYQGINVHNAERVRQLAHDGHEIVYVPCHRSHMDYLLLSYVLYHQGLVPPHIAAGINLNFWPAGPIFRRLGAFFIRRTFKGNKLYSTVFREYLGELFSRGYSVEYFVEGGRSRTGRLLDPKTGTLSMTIQAMLRGGTRPITLVPIYIGYEHVMEVGTYAKELRGATKEKESLPQMVRGLSKLRNLGQGYVNFGEPLPLMTYLNQHVPDWREAIDPIEAVRPSWLTPTVNSIAADLMVRINNAGAANAMNLCCTALLASRQRSLTREQLTQQLECYPRAAAQCALFSGCDRPIRFSQRAHRSCAADEQVRSGEGHHWRHHHPAARAGGADDLLSQQYRPYAGDAVAVSRSGDSASSSQPRRSAASCGNTLSVPQGRAVPALGKSGAGRSGGCADCRDAASGADRRRWRCHEPQPVALAPCSCWPLAPARRCSAMPSPSGC